MSSKQEEEEVKSVPNDNGDDDDCDDLRTRTTYQLFIEIQRLAMLHHSVNEHSSTPIVNDAFRAALQTIQNRVSDIAAEIERRRRLEKRRLVNDAEKKRKLDKETKKKKNTTEKKQKSMIPDD